MFLVTIPMVLVSGYAAPIENMPVWLQNLSWFNPSRHMLTLVEGIFLKAMPAKIVFARLTPVVLIGSVALFLAHALIIRRLRRGL